MRTKPYSVFRSLKKITKGHLRVRTSEQVYNFPAVPAEKEYARGNIAELRVVSDVFWIRLCAMGALGFAEAYMYGDVQCDDLIAVFQAGVIRLDPAYELT